MVTIYTIALTAACCAAVALVVISERGARPVGSSWVSVSTLALLAGTSATLSTLAYAMADENSQNLLPLVIADVTMPLSVGLLAAAMRRATAKTHTWAMWFLLVSLGVGALTVYVSVDASYYVKLVALSTFSLIAATACYQGREHLPRLGALLVGITVTVYGVYCAARLIVPLYVGNDDFYVQLLLTQGPATIVAAITVAVAAAGMILIVRGVNPDDATRIVNTRALTDWMEALLAMSPTVTTIGISIPDAQLHRTAFGRPWALAITHAATTATLEVMPSGAIIGRVAPNTLVVLHFGGTTLDVDVIRERLQKSYAEMMPPSAPTRPPELVVERAVFSSSAELRRFARQSRATARRAMSSERAR
ncbi:hypothetical protein [Microbacterium marmarense]|uniref:MHYT domain-containing protein n=1 Tax=Microbacterium marmarense TaxID=3122051 RepID=A0ABU8LUS8_9MICO